MGLRSRLRSLTYRLARKLDPAPPSPVRPPFAAVAAAGYVAPPLPIEVDVAPEVLHALFARTQAQWAKLGEADPYWSVLTDDAFHADRFDAATAERFYETGRGNADLIELFEARAGASVARGTCLELGCGVGRVTRWLAPKFERVVAVDVSPGNLAIAAERLSAAGVTNVDFVLLREAGEVEALPAFDLLYSMIVLQHDSPPVQAFLLDRLLDKVRPGGGALFQAVTDLPGYGFSATDYLASPDPVMELHALPQARILRLFRKHGLEAQAVAMDAWLDAYGSNTFFATKPG